MFIPPAPFFQLVLNTQENHKRMRITEIFKILSHSYITNLICFLKGFIVYHFEIKKTYLL